MFDFLKKKDHKQPENAAACSGDESCPMCHVSEEVVAVFETSEKVTIKKEGKDE